MSLKFIAEVAFGVLYNSREDLFLVIGQIETELYSETLEFLYKRGTLHDINTALESIKVIDIPIKGKLSRLIMPRVSMHFMSRGTHCEGIEKLNIPSTEEITEFSTFLKDRGIEEIPALYLASYSS
jgi:hypothetical protein